MYFTFQQSLVFLWPIFSEPEMRLLAAAWRCYEMCALSGLCEAPGGLLYVCMGTMCVERRCQLRLNGPTASKEWQTLCDELLSPYGFTEHTV